MPRIKCKFVHSGNHKKCTRWALEDHTYCEIHSSNEIRVADEGGGARDEHIILPLPPQQQQEDVMGYRNPFDQRLVEENMKLKGEVDRLMNELNRLTIALTAVTTVNNGDSVRQNSITVTGGKKTQGIEEQQQVSSRRPTEKKVWNKARLLFYNEVKKNSDLLNTILARLKASDLIEPAAAVKDIPWLNIKKVSDHMFDQKDLAERKMYYDVSFDLLMKRPAKELKEI